MITEDYVSREVAKLLKEKGFNEFGHYEYHDTLSKPHFHKKSHNFNGDEYANCGTKWYSAPTHQMAMKWLREVHNQHVQIKYFHGAYQEFEYVVINTFNGKAYHEPISFSSYEEAVEAALKYTLKHLI